MSTKKIQANNLEAIQEELKKLGVSLTESQTEVLSSEKKHYHLLLVTIKVNPSSPKNEVISIVSKHRKRGFEKIVENYARHGYTACLILHDPSKEGDEEVVIPQHKITKTEQEIRAELQKEFDAKFDERLQEKLKEMKSEETAQGPGNQDNDSDEKELIEFNVDGSTLADLKELSDKHDFKLPSRMPIAEAKEFIKKAIDTHNSDVLNNAKA